MVEAKEIRWWEHDGGIEDYDKKIKIESRNRVDIIELLKKCGVNRNAKNKFREYSMAKKICFEGMFIDCSIYDRQIKWICDYLKI